MKMLTRAILLVIFWSSALLTAWAQIPETPATITQFLGTKYGPNAPSLLAPANGSTGVSATPLISWSCTGLNATSFNIMMSTANPPTLYKSGVVGCSYQVPISLPLPAGVKQYIRLVAVNAKTSTNGAVNSFTVASATVVLSPNCTAITPGVGTLVAMDGTWTVTVAQSMLLNGQDTGGAGSILEISNNQIFALGTDNNWYIWSDASRTWSATGMPNPCATTTTTTFKVGWTPEPPDTNTPPTYTVTGYNVWVDTVKLSVQPTIDLTCPGGTCLASVPLVTGVHAIAISAVGTSNGSPAESSIAGCTSCSVSVTAP